VKLGLIDRIIDWRLSSVYLTEKIEEFFMNEFLRGVVREILGERESTKIEMFSSCILP